MPVQKLTNPVEQIRDKESCVTSRRCEFFARYEEITSSSTSDGAPRWWQGRLRSLFVVKMLQALVSITS